MKAFLHLNKQKLPFLILFLAIIGLLISLVMLGLLYWRLGAIAEPVAELMLYLLALMVFFPVLILGAAYWLWKIKADLRNKALQVPPFHQLALIGFKMVLLHEKSKFYFTEETKLAIINGFTLFMEVDHEHKRNIFFKILFSPDDIKALREKLLAVKKSGLTYDLAGLTKNYNLDNLFVHTPQQLRADLERFTEFVQKELKLF